jgi:glutamate-1-semialdehyde 2,1-aminomutase
MTSFKKSIELFQSIENLVPGGTHSNVRFIDSLGQPIYFKRGKGSRLWDVDGNEWLDILVDMGCCVLGHGNDKIMVAVANELASGLLASQETELTIAVARKLADLIPCAENVRFANTGTEAVIKSLMIARGFTGKDKIVKIEGGYDGWSAEVAISQKPDMNSLGPEESIRPFPDTQGIPKRILDDVVVIPFNNAEVAEKVIRKNKDLAALIVEPVLFNLGAVMPKPGYLRRLREITEENDVLLIFDEVITGFRLAPGGAQEYFHVEPDLAIYSKAIANGFPFSAIAGRSDVIGVTAPKLLGGRVYYGGTYNGSQLSLAAASVALSEYKRGEVQEYLNNETRRMQNEFKEIVEDLGLQARMQGVGGQFQVYFTETEITDYRTAMKANREMYLRFQEGLMQRNVLPFANPPNHLVHHGISFAHTRADIDELILKMRQSLEAVATNTADRR